MAEELDLLRPTTMAVAGTFDAAAAVTSQAGQLIHRNRDQIRSELSVAAQHVSEWMAKRAAENAREQVQAERDWWTDLVGASERRQQYEDDHVRRQAAASMLKWRIAFEATNFVVTNVVPPALDAYARWSWACYLHDLVTFCGSTAGGDVPLAVQAYTTRVAIRPFGFWNPVNRKITQPGRPANLQSIRSYKDMSDDLRNRAGLAAFVARARALSAQVPEVSQDLVLERARNDRDLQLIISDVVGIGKSALPERLNAWSECYVADDVDVMHAMQTTGILAGMVLRKLDVDPVRQSEFLESIVAYDHDRGRRADTIALAKNAFVGAATLATVAASLGAAPAVVGAAGTALLAAGQASGLKLEPAVHEALEQHGAKPT